MRVGFGCGVVMALVTSVCGLGAGAQTSDGERCGKLAGLKLAQAEVTSARMVEAGALAGGSTGPRVRAAVARQMPAFCEVQVTDRPSADSDIKTEIWLPVEGWNGRFRGQGNGGFAGSIDFAAMAAAVTQGYATAGTDTGHVGGQPAFALHHPETVTDFGWRAVHEMTLEAKAVATAFYGKAPVKSYFASCSNGGREAMMEAERFPGDYDGILAGAPAWNWTSLVGGGAVLLKGIYSRPDGLLTAAQVPAIAAAVRAACDAQDGVADGVLNDPRTCRFDPAMLACKDAVTPNCLSPGQVATLNALYAPKVDADGRQLLPMALPGAEEGSNGWSTWITGNGRAKSLGEFFSVGFFADFVAEDAGWTIERFEAGKDLKLAEQKTGRALNATDLNLKPFLGRGGKLMVYHGWNDAAIPALNTVALYDGVRTASGAAADAGVRLYMVPGMQHCSEGPGATEFGQSGEDGRGDAGHDIFTAMVQWVEAGSAPGVIVAKKSGEMRGAHAPGTQPPVLFTRPLCAFPQVAKYVSGDTNDAGSFACGAAAK